METLAVRIAAKAYNQTQMLTSLPPAIRRFSPCHRTAPVVAALAAVGLCLSTLANAQTTAADKPAVTATTVAALNTPDLAIMVDHALANYPALIVAQSARNVARYDIERAQAKHYPTVSVAGSRKLDGAVTGSLGPRVNLNLYASGAIEAEVERERWREMALTSTESERREDIAFDVVQAYYRVLAAVRLRDTTRRSLDRHLELVDDFREIAKIDQGRRFDLVQSQARAEQVRFQLAERDTEIALAREALARFYPEPFDPERLPMPPAMPNPLPVTVEGQALLAEKHPAVLAAERQLMAARANLKVAKGNRGPRVDVESQTGANRFSQLTLSWPAFDMSASAAQSSADAALLGAAAEVDEQRRLVLETQRRAIAAWRTANERQRIAENQIDIAGQLVEVYREQFGIGRRNLLDLLNAYSELASAEAAAESSKIDAGLARREVEYAIGHLSRAVTSEQP